MNQKIINLRNAASPPGNGNSPSRNGTGVIGEPCCWYPWVTFDGIKDPVVDISPFPTTPDEATAAIKDGNVYPVPIDAATDGCPNREAAAAAAEGCDKELGATDDGKLS